MNILITNTDGVTLSVPTSISKLVMNEPTWDSKGDRVVTQTPFGWTVKGIILGGDTMCVLADEKGKRIATLTIDKDQDIPTVFGNLSLLVGSK